MDCGPTCLCMVSKYYGKHYKTDSIQNSTGYCKEGVSLLAIADAAEKIGFRTRGVQLTHDQLTKDAILPAILHWGQNHFVVLLPPNRWHKTKIHIGDPVVKLGITNVQKGILNVWSCRIWRR